MELVNMVESSSQFKTVAKPVPADSLKAQAEPPALTAAKADAKSKGLKQIPANWDGNYLKLPKGVYQFVVAHEKYIMPALKEKNAALAQKPDFQSVRVALWSGDFVVKAYREDWREVVNKAMGY
jgi:hypothetical protein